MHCIALRFGWRPYLWSSSAAMNSVRCWLVMRRSLPILMLRSWPVRSGSYAFSVNVIDQNNGIATTSITLVGDRGADPQLPGPPSGTVGTPYTGALTATGGTTPYSWSVSSGTLPAGISLNATTGLLAGTPTVAGTSSFTIKVTDAGNQTATEATSITVAAGVLAISVPSGASLPSVSPGGTTSAQLGAVTDNRRNEQCLMDGNGQRNDLYYRRPHRSGDDPAQPDHLLVGARDRHYGHRHVHAGGRQASTAAAVNLTMSRTAFSLVTGSSANSASWNPTVSVSVPPSAIGGTYTATITHSVA
jgi:hypothetical protein